MAFAATAILEVQNGGSDTANGGGFDPGATLATDLAATSGNTSSPVVTSASYTFVAGDVGKYLFIKSGTNWVPGWYAIASVSAGAATLTASVGNVWLYRNSGTNNTNLVVGCATTASPTAGTWSIDYSIASSAAVSFTDMVIDATTNTKFTSAGNPVGVNMIGNYISVTSGTGFTVQRVVINSVAGTTATCDKSLGTLSSTGGNGGLGGAFASPGKAGSIMVGSNLMYVKYNATPYSISSTSVNVTGGHPSIPSSTTNFAGMIGYDVTRTIQNLDSNLTLITTDINSATAILTNGSCFVRNFKITNPTSKTGTIGINLSNTYDFCERIWCDSLAGNAISMGGNNAVIDCFVNGGQGINGAGASLLVGVVVNNCAASFLSGTGVKYINCANLNSTDTTHPGFTLNDFSTAINCVVYGGAAGHTTDGISFVSGHQITVINCVVVNQTRYSFVDNVTYVGVSSNQLINCFSYNPTTAHINNINADNIRNLTILTGNPFTNPGGGDYTLNNTAGAGALLRAAGFPTQYMGLSQANNLDAGIFQHAAASATGGLINLGLRGGFTD